MFDPRIGRLWPRAAAAVLLGATAFIAPARAQTVEIDTSAAGRAQTIDGFGTCLSGGEAQQSWWKALYFDDLRASILRFDLTPRFKSPYSDFAYNSPGFPGAAALPGPDHDNVRAYTDAASYARPWGGHSAKIAVMGPDIDRNLEYFDFDAEMARSAGLAAQAAAQRLHSLGDFKLVASLWSPAPWLKLSSGRAIAGLRGSKPLDGAPWPFIWNGNFAGGVLDTSGIPRVELDDSSLGGTGPTSALTQFARGLAAYLRGFQRKYSVRLYAISLQNELSFEEYYNSCSYPRAAGYVAALEAARAELNRYDDLRAIRIMGPEDLLSADLYGLWQSGSGSSMRHRNLQLLQAVAADPAAARALDFFCIHGYAADGVTAAGASPALWQAWAEGWTWEPARGLPTFAKGFTAYHKKSWMTETSGEAASWLAPAGGFPSEGAFGIALKIHQALTAGRESAWLYWQLTDGKPVRGETLTDADLRGASPKYVAVKHFFRYIRPGAVRVLARVRGDDALLASAYLHDRDASLTVVLVNTSPRDASVTVVLPTSPRAFGAFEAVTSHDGSYLKPSTPVVADASLRLAVPGYGVVTLFGHGVPGGSADAPAGSAPGVSGPGAAVVVAGTRAKQASPPVRARAGCGCSVGRARDWPAALAAFGVLSLVLARRRRRDATCRLW